MAILILVGNNEAERKFSQWFIQDCLAQLEKLAPGLDIRIYPDIGNKDEIDFVLVWKHAPGVFSQFPKLKAIATLSAGVDFILLDKTLPKNIPLVRITDPFMAKDITQYVVANVLHYMKRLEFYKNKQAEKNWFRQPPFNFSDKTVGIMGVGFLGSQAAQALQFLGLKVIGWSNSTKNLKGIQEFVGQEEFKIFLSKSDILVCMLPLTPATENIINADNLALLPKDAYLINLGRGGHVVDADLLDALNAGHLSGACLDVFREEPLPATHLFWNHPLIRVTPHIASITNLETAMPQVAENYRRLQVGEALLNVVDVARGY
jgi:glyoxylate/hydroxypyruvate reductase A